MKVGRGGKCWKEVNKGVQKNLGRGIGKILGLWRKVGETYTLLPVQSVMGNEFLFLEEGAYRGINLKKVEHHTIHGNTIVFNNGKCAGAAYVGNTHTKATEHNTIHRHTLVSMSTGE